MAAWAAAQPELCVSLDFHMGQFEEFRKYPLTENISVFHFKCLILLTYTFF